MAARRRCRSSRARWANKGGTTSRRRAEQAPAGRRRIRCRHLCAAARQALSQTWRWEIDQINAAAQKNVNAEAVIGKGTREELRPEILRLTQQNENQRLLRESAPGLTQKMLPHRWRIYVDRAGASQRPLGGLLVFWLVTIFFSFGLLSPRNITVIGGLVLASLSTAGAIFMILELDMTFHGLINISPRPLELALEQTLITN